MPKISPVVDLVSVGLGLRQGLHILETLRVNAQGILQQLVEKDVVHLAFHLRLQTRRQVLLIVDIGLHALRVRQDLQHHIEILIERLALDLLDVAGTVTKLVVFVILEVVDEDLALVHHKDSRELPFFAERHKQHRQHNHSHQQHRHQDGDDDERFLLDARQIFARNNQEGLILHGRVVGWPVPPAR